MQKKKGISLITLVITIIVMTIIAGVIIFTLSDSDIFNKANEAVAKTNLNQIQTLVTTLWAEAYLDPDITTDDQYREYVEKGLRDNGVNLNEYVFDITREGAKVEGPDITKPTITLTADKQGVGVGGTLTYTVTFNDNKEVASVDFDASDVTITGFTADVTVTGEGNTKTLTLSNIQGEAGEKMVTIAEGVVKDVAGNQSAVTTIKLSILEKIGDLITSASDYGKTVNYEANGITDWKILYKQKVEGKEYVYLIASEALAYDQVPTKLTETIEKGGAGAIVAAQPVMLGSGVERNVGKIYWKEGNAPTSAAIIDNPKLWMAEWGDYDSYNTAINGRCVSYFLKEDLWLDFKNTEKYKDTNGKPYVVGAIGTPTAEMVVASWNAKRTATGDTTTYNKILQLAPRESIGYYVYDITSGKVSDYKYDQSITTSDSLYIWSTASSSSVWLASPSAMGTIWVLMLSWQGRIDEYKYHYISSGISYYGVRPVVCLSADIPASVDVNGNFVI